MVVIISFYVRRSVHASTSNVNYESYLLVLRVYDIGRPLWTIRLLASE